MVAVKVTPAERTAIEQEARRARIGAGPLLRQRFFAGMTSDRATAEMTSATG